MRWGSSTAWSQPSQYWCVHQKQTSILQRGVAFQPAPIACSSPASTLLPLQHHSPVFAQQGPPVPGVPSYPCERLGPEGASVPDTSLLISSVSALSCHCSSSEPSRAAAGTHTLNVMNKSQQRSVVIMVTTLALNRTMRCTTDSRDLPALLLPAPHQPQLIASPLCF